MGTSFRTYVELQPPKNAATWYNPASITNMPSKRPPSNEDSQPEQGLSQWISRHPKAEGFVFGIASSLVAAIIFYVLVESRSRDLSLTVNPSKTTIVRAGQSSDLHVLYKGQNVSADVTGLQIRIWNAGTESIHSEHVLSPIILETSPKVPILEVRKRHDRPEARILLDESQLADGKVGVSWKILEHNDGAVVQFIVAGPSTVTVVGHGSVEGDRTIRLVRSAEFDRTADPFAYISARVMLSVAMSYIAQFLLLVVLVLRVVQFGPLTLIVKRHLLVLLLIGMIVASAVFYLSFHLPSPLPFD